MGEEKERMLHSDGRTDHKGLVFYKQALRGNHYRRVHWRTEAELAEEEA